MRINGKTDACVTSTLNLTTSHVFFDCSIDKQKNQRILNTKAVEFDTTLDKRWIMFERERNARSAGLAWAAASVDPGQGLVHEG